MIRSLFLLSGLALLLLSCNGPKSVTKRANELQMAGMDRQAADLYYLALRKKPGYLDAMVGLKMAGQGVLDARTGEFQGYALGGQRAEAISTYEDMTRYVAKMSSVKVDLLIPPSVVSSHANLVDDHLIELDAEAHEQLAAEDFAGAQTSLEEIIRLDPTYGDAAALLIVAKAEPQYRAGKLAYEAAFFRKASASFNGVLKLDRAYKDAAVLLASALDEGRFNVAVTSFDSNANQKDIALEMRSGIQNALLNTTDPFIGVVDRTLREDIIAEQELSLSGISDETVDVGGLAGAKAILTGAVLQFSSETSRQISTTRNAFRKFFKEVVDDEGKTRKVAAYAPARYTLHNQSRTVQLKFEIKLVSTETGAVLMSQVEQVQVEDAIEFAVSQVQAGSLYPARSNGEVDRSGNRRMKQLLSAPRELKPASAMRNQLVNEAIVRGQRDIEKFLAKHIQ